MCLNRAINIKAIIILASISGFVTCQAYQAPDQFEVLVPQNHISYNGKQSKSIGAFTYRPSDKRFYVSTFGSNQGIRCFVSPDESFPDWSAHPWAYVENTVSDSKGKSWQCATVSDLGRITGSTDIEGGIFFPQKMAFISGMLLNPSPVIINDIYYDTGQLVIISDNSTAITADATKRFLSWDLREIWSPTDKQPDRANAHYDTTSLMTEIYGSEYGYGCTNWNDAFNKLMSLQDMANAIDKGPVSPTASDQVGGRRAVFSSNGDKLYFVSMDSRTGRMFTGLWSIDIQTRQIHRLFDDTISVSTFTTSEPGVLPVYTRNFTDQNWDENYDQVLFNGTDASGNLCGLNCLVDDGSMSPSIYNVIDGSEFLDFTETYDPNYADSGGLLKIWSVTTDDSGSIYMHTRNPSGLYRYDGEGRLLCLSSQIQHIMFNRALGSNSNNTSYYRAMTRQILPEYVDPNSPDAKTITQVMYMSVGGYCVAGINVYEPCDFNRDGVVDLVDMNFFKQQLKKTRDNVLPIITEGQAFLDYLKADLNGNGSLNEEGTGLREACVTGKDVEVLHRFVLPGNLNFDQGVDMKDFVIFTANFLMNGKNWAQGDFDFDDDVDAADLVLLAEHWLDYDD